MNKLTYIALIAGSLLALTLVSIQPSWAATASPSASPKASTSPSPAATPETLEETTQNLRERIEKIVNEKRDQIEGTLETLSRPKRAFVGQIERVTEESLTVKTTKGINILSIDKNILLVKKSKTIKISDIAVGDWAIVMGVVAEDDSFAPKRIIISSENLRPRPFTVAVGSITGLDTKNITIQPRSGESNFTVVINKSTSFQDLQAKPARQQDLSQDMQVLVIAYRDDSNQLIATVVKLLTALPSPSPSSTAKTRR
jgi:hypothetical protein